MKKITIIASSVIVVGNCLIQILNKVDEIEDVKNKSSFINGVIKRNKDKNNKEIIRNTVSKQILEYVENN